jgi:hypothetical protein
MPDAGVGQGKRVLMDFVHGDDLDRLAGFGNCRRDRIGRRAIRPDDQHRPAIGVAPETHELTAVGDRVTTELATAVGGRHQAAAGQAARDAACRGRRQSDDRENKKMIARCRGSLGSTVAEKRCLMRHPPPSAAGPAAPPTTIRIIMIGPCHGLRKATGLT